MRRFSLSILLLFAVMNIAMAAPVSEGQARNIAAKFMADRHLPTAGLTLANGSQRFNASPSTAMPLYVFNAPQHAGYVIIAGDARVPAVLGYSDNGFIDMDNAAPALQEWMAGYAAQIERLAKDPALNVPLHTTGTAVAPLVKCQWAQTSPYNILMPYVGNMQGYTGCGATAMAQIMYYHRWPLQTTSAIPAYTTTTNSISMPELPVTTFAWGDMRDTYLTNDLNSTSAVAVAQLMKYCAQAIKMDFMSNGSNSYTNDIYDAFYTYFGYGPNAHSMTRANYSTEEWESVIINELSQRRPVLYRAANGDGGHFFVCDGFDGNGMFHINWGWGGNDDGYFLLNVLDPYEHDATVPSSAWGFIDGQWMIAGIQPDNGGNFELAVESRNFTTDYTSSTRSNSSKSFTMTVDCRFYNPTSRSISFAGGFGLFQNGQFIKTVYNFNYTGNLRPNYYTTYTGRTLTIGGVADGTYRIMPVYAESGTTNWRPCLGAQGNYIEIVISNNRCTATGYGSAAQRSYNCNGVTTSGTMYVNRPVRATVNLTNNGGTRGDMVYMFVGSSFVSAAMVDIEKGQSGNLDIQFWPTSTGTKTLKFSFNADGSDPFATSSVTIKSMPSASLSGNYTVQNIIDPSNYIVCGKTFVVNVTVTNNGSTTYNDDIVGRLAKQAYGNYGNFVQTQQQHVTLAARQSTTLRFEFDNVVDGWNYFALFDYYSAGNLVRIDTTPFYYLVFPAEPQYIIGDANGDGNVDPSDISALINYLLNGAQIDMNGGDVNQDGSIDPADISALINMLLNG